jgi:hypothetical protein
VADTGSFGALVQVARTPGEMATGLRAAIAAAPSAREARTAFAKENSWDARAREYVQFIASLA